MPPRSYATPEGFRQALEQRVRAAAGASGMGRFSRNLRSVQVEGAQRAPLPIATVPLLRRLPRAP
jgi:hypothetical protein